MATLSTVMPTKLVDNGENIFWKRRFADVRTSLRLRSAVKLDLESNFLLEALSLETW